MPKAKDYQTEKREFRGTKIAITSYKIGSKYFCHITNEDPGATIARAEGPSRDEAISQAMDKAFNRLK